MPKLQRPLLGSARAPPLPSWSVAFASQADAGSCVSVIAFGLVFGYLWGFVLRSGLALAFRFAGASAGCKGLCEKSTRNLQGSPDLRDSCDRLDPKD